MELIDVHEEVVDELDKNQVLGVQDLKSAADTAGATAIEEEIQNEL